MSYRIAFLFLAILLTGASVPAQSTKPQPGEVLELDIARNVKMKFCWVPAGEAQMGSTLAERQEAFKNVKADAERARLATETEEVRGKFKTAGFWLGKFAVTQAEWTAVMGKNPSHFVAGQPIVKKAGITDTSRFPVDNISWDDCQQFIKKLNENGTKTLRGKFALPDEDQWEYACRGGKGNQQAYYFGPSHNGKLANSNGEHPFGTETKGPVIDHPVNVGSYEKVAPHPWGLCDMHGNIWQWCENKYSNVNDLRVVRGGTYSSGCRGARAACRQGKSPSERSKYYGVRLVFMAE